MFEFDVLRTLLFDGIFSTFFVFSLGYPHLLECTLYEQYKFRINNPCLHIEYYIRIIHSMYSGGKLCTRIVGHRDMGHRDMG